MRRQIEKHGSRTRVDLRHKQSAVRDQGKRPTCLAFAATSGHECLRGDGQLLSVEYLHWTSCKRDGASAKGVSLRTTLEALLGVGQPHEEVWPYRDDQDDIAADYLPPYINTKDCFRVGWGVEINPMIEELKRHLSAGRVVILGMRLFRSFYYAEAGRIPMPERTEPYYGGHAVLVVGYDDDPQIVVFKNSWGASWGNDGYGFLPYDYVSDHALAAVVLSNGDPSAAYE